MDRGFVLETTSGLVEFSIQRDEVRHLDTTATGENIDNILLLLECWMCLLADSPLNTSCGPKPVKLFRQFKRDFLSRPLRDTIKMYSEIGHSLASTVTRVSPTELTLEWIPEFKRTPVFKEFHLWYRSHDVQMFSFIYTFLNFGKKLDFVDENLNTIAFRGWLDVEYKLSDLCLDDVIVSGLRAIVAEILPSLPFTPFRPRFGPKGVAEKEVRGKIAKSSKLRYHPEIDRVLFGNNDSLPKELGFHRGVLTNPTLWDDTSNEWSIDWSELLFRPRDATKSRSVCMEPNTVMWAQQGLLDQVLGGFDRSLIARRFIDIKDQTRNKRLALVGSLTSRVDTIDLSSASDSVSLELVKRVFPDTVIPYFLAARTSKVRTTTGQIIEVKKFAPMGSALCFPVQCIIFTSIVIYAAMLHSSALAVGSSLPSEHPMLDDVRLSVDKLFRQIGSRNWHTGRYMPATIYGDDICVDSKLTPHVVSLLDALGFSVNLRKSFTGTQSFRESCGGYYVAGVEVTPLFYRVKRFGRSIGPECVASIISTLNRAGDRRFFNLRKRLIHFLLEYPVEGVSQFRGKNPFLFSSDKSLGYAIYSSNPRNDHLQSKFHHDWQTDGYVCIMQTVRDRIIPEDDNEVDSLERYLHDQWWHSRSRGVEPDFGMSAPRYDASGSRLRLRWVRSEQ